jgi:hypothetical protein
MADLNEKSLLELREALRGPNMAFKPSRIVVSQEGLDRVKALCAADPEYRKRVLAEFPQLDGII